MDIQQALSIAMFAIAQDLRKALRGVAPVRTGVLKGSIKVEQTANGLMMYFVDYAKFVEFGTVNQKPNPFIRTTLHTKLRGIIQKRLNEVMV